MDSGQRAVKRRHAVLEAALIILAFAAALYFLLGTT
jgi:hypothetical protein